MQLSETFKTGLVEFIRRTSAELPNDVIRALIQAQDPEASSPAAANALKTILHNIELLQQGSTPICQDTGMLIFYVDYPAGVSTIPMRWLIQEAVAEATAKSYLRPNAVDSLTGKNSVPELAALEAKILGKANQLGIGPMGFGGKTTLLGVKADWAHRLPASFFISVSYMCWADRRRTMMFYDGRMEID